MAESNFQVDLDELRAAHTALGQVVDVNTAVSRALPAGGSPVSGGAPPASLARAVSGYSGLLEHLADQQRRGTEAIEETRRRLADIEAAYRAADHL